LQAQPSEKKKWQYACRLFGMNSLKKGKMWHIDPLPHGDSVNSGCCYIMPATDTHTTIEQWSYATSFYAIAWKTGSCGNEHACNNRRMVFSVGSAPRLYSEHPRLAECSSTELSGVEWNGVK
jgi:hypothetical protein